MFEIELYWKRGLYIWGFILTLFGGYVLVLTELIDNTNCLNESTKCDQYYPYLAIIAFIGLVSSTAWIYIERGSKSIMENWERHIDYLEFTVTGHLHKTILGKKSNHFSVSKINQHIIIGIGSLWFCFLYLPMDKIIVNQNSLKWLCIMAVEIAVVILVMIVANLAWHTTEETMPEKNKMKAEKFDLHQRKRGT